MTPPSPPQPPLTPPQPPLPPEIPPPNEPPLEEEPLCDIHCWLTILQIISDILSSFYWVSVLITGRAFFQCQLEGNCFGVNFSDTFNVSRTLKRRLRLPMMSLQNALALANNLIALKSFAEDAVQGEAKDLVAFARTRLEENMEIAQATLGRLQEMASSGLASPEAAAAVARLQAAVSSSLSEYDLSDISGASERAAPGVTEWNDKVSDKIREVMGAKDDYFSAVDDVLLCQWMGLFGEGASTLLGQLSGGGEEVSGGGSEDAPGGDVPRGGEDPGSTGEADVPPPPPSGGDEDGPPPPPPPSLRRRRRRVINEEATSASHSGGAADRCQLRGRRLRTGGAKGCCAAGRAAVAASNRAKRGVSFFRRQSSARGGSDAGDADDGDAQSPGSFARAASRTARRAPSRTARRVSLSSLPPGMPT